MNFQELEHAIRAACDVADDDELYIFGSQAILGEHPEAPEALRASIEVDVQPKNRPEAVDDVDGALGELSQFHETHGFYVHGLSIETATLPDGWKDRTIEVRSDHGTKGNTGHCLEAHDLATSKLVAFRDKDRQFVNTLMAENLVDTRQLIERIGSLPIDRGEQIRLQRWVELTAADLAEN